MEINSQALKNRPLIISQCALEAQDEIVNNIICSKMAVLEDILSDPNMQSAAKMFQSTHECNQTGFGNLKTAHDCDAVFYVISNMHECERLEINFSRCGI